MHFEKASSDCCRVDAEPVVDELLVAAVDPRLATPALDDPPHPDAARARATAATAAAATPTRPARLPRPEPVVCPGVLSDSCCTWPPEGFSTPTSVSQSVCV
jgi:hypothetical protein